MIMTEQLHDLPAPISRSLSDLVDAAASTFGDDLKSVILYGSAADGTLRPTSDVNVLLVLSVFDPAKANAIRAPYSVAEAAIAEPETMEPAAIIATISFFMFAFIFVTPDV